MSRIVIAVLCMLSAGVAGAQAVELGGAEVRLGTDKSNALAALSSRFEIVPGLDGYTLFRGREGERLGEPVGTLRFSDGRLTQVQRLLGSFYGEAAARTLRRMIAAFESAPEGDNPHLIETRSGSSGKGLSSRVVFNLPDRQIVISLYQPNDRSAPETAEVSEHFRLQER